MAAAARDESVTCAICLEQVKEPLTLPCGHSYCRDCIQRLFKTPEPGPEPEPASRQDFLRYSKYITLDPNTVNPHLMLSEENRRVTRPSAEAQRYPYHPDRFDELLQALSREALMGRCYWEVEWSNLRGINIAVSYKDIHRKGNHHESWFGFNDKSWVLGCYEEEYSFRFNSVISEFSDPVSHTVGVYLDHSAGVLAFYSVQDQTMTLLHKVQTVFTKPLYAGVGVGGFGTVHFPKLRSSQ